MAEKVKFKSLDSRFKSPEEKYLDFDFIHNTIPRVHNGDSSYGWCLRHPNTTFRYNPTVPSGTSLTVLTGLVNNLMNRWEFHVLKVDEWMEISPSHPYYQTMIRQKQDIIRQVKEGLATVDRAISDVELLMHDARRYKEILSFFSKKDEHSLKAMFIDQVDVNLPEGVSLRSIAPRWPTIIADFQQLDDEDDTPEKIMKKLEVSRAEAVVLATKVRLYKKWKEFFGSQVKDRYKYIIERLQGRRASIEEYRNWIRPLIRRVLQMKEVDDKSFIMDKNLPVGSGMPVALQYVEYWAWSRLEGLEPDEPHKTPKTIYESKGAKAVYGTQQFRVTPGGVPRFVIEPYDEVVKKFIPLIEKKHGVKITKEDIMLARQWLFEKGSPGVQWYVLTRFPVAIMDWKLPSGLSVEDVDFNKLSTIFITQNIMLVKFLEIIAEEKKVDIYIDELLGKKVLSENGKVQEIDEILALEFPEIYGKKEEEKKKGLKESLSGFKISTKSSMAKFITALNYIFGLKLGFIHGPYDPSVNDLLFYGYGRPYLREIFDAKVWAYLQKNFGSV
jgi:hypothetical protein